MDKLDDQPDLNPVPPRPAPVLDYSRPWRVPGIARHSATVQFLAGLGVYILVTGSTFGLSMRFSGDAAAFACSYCFVLLFVCVAGVGIQSRYGWTAFLPGVLTGVGVTCLIGPIAICGHALR